MVSEVEDPVSRPAAFAPVVEVKSKWELVDYGEDSDERYTMLLSLSIVL